MLPLCQMMAGSGSAFHHVAAAPAEPLVVALSSSAAVLFNSNTNSEVHRWSIAGASAAAFSSGQCSLERCDSIQSPSDGWQSVDLCLIFILHCVDGQKVAILTETGEVHVCGTADKERTAVTVLSSVSCLGF